MDRMPGSGEAQLPVQQEGMTSMHEGGLEVVAPVVGDVATTGASLAEYPVVTPVWTGPRNFRDHTNPYTMKTPAWWGSKRHT